MLGLKVLSALETMPEQVWLSRHGNAFILNGFVCDECGEVIGSKNQECVNGEVCDPSDEYIGTVARGSLDDVIEWILCNTHQTVTKRSEVASKDKQTGDSWEFKI